MWRSNRLSYRTVRFCGATPLPYGGRAGGGGAGKLPFPGRGARYGFIPAGRGRHKGAAAKQPFRYVLAKSKEPLSKTLSRDCAAVSVLPCLTTRTKRPRAACFECWLRFHFADTLQKGGVPAAPSGTATLLRLSPNHRFRPRPTLAVTAFRRPRLSWLDGRCVQGPGTYSPRRG